jgi:hypothetical protein
MILTRIQNLRLTLLMITIGLSSVSGFSQNLKTIKLEDIPQKKIRNFIISRSIDKMKDFSLIHASWKKEAKESDFHIIEKTFYVDNKLPQVWELYRDVNPVKMWTAKSVRFGLMISKCSNSVIYTNSLYYAGIDTGQVYFLDLRFIRGLFNIPVAFEIITIDKAHQIMEFSYIENNKSLGKQTLFFIDNGDGRTRIVHRSFFRSESRLRDLLLYPYFHNRFIRQFHGNMRHLNTIQKLA